MNEILQRLMDATVEVFPNSQRFGFYFRKGESGLFDDIERLEIIAVTNSKGDEKPLLEIDRKALEIKIWFDFREIVKIPIKKEHGLDKIVLNLAERLEKIPQNN